MSTKEGYYEGIGTVQKYLCGKRHSHGEKLIDMEYVYCEIKKGRSRQSVAAELGVHVNTLYNHHKKYQAQLQVLLKQREESLDKIKHLEEEVPPLPDEYT